MAEELVYSGRVWLFGDSVDTDQILPGYAMSYPREQLRSCVMAGSTRQNFAAEVRPGDIIVAGGNFGYGSSREQAPLALKDAGVALIIAASFGRIFRRNAINIGLAVLQAQTGGQVQDGDIITADIRSGQVVLPDRSIINGQAPGENVIAVLAAGGLINKVRLQLAKERG